MTIAFQRMFGILYRWNKNQVMPSLSKPHELSYRSNIICEFIINFILLYLYSKDFIAVVNLYIFVQISRVLPLCTLLMCTFHFV